MRPTRLLIALCVSVPLFAAADEPAKQSPELQILAQLAGKWNVTVVSKPAAWKLDGGRSSETKSAEWILDGQFLQEATHSDNHEARTLFGYDKNKKVYQAWYFHSDGTTGNWSGTWDSQQKTMTWKSNDQNLDAVTTHRFVSKDQFDITVVIKDKTGKLLMHVEAEHKRVKK